MTLAAKILEVFSPANPDLGQVEEVITFMRFKMALNYVRRLRTIQKVIPSFTADRYEDLMLSVDNHSY